jgi:hypothetical protein
MHHLFYSIHSGIRIYDKRILISVRKRVYLYFLLIGMLGISNIKEATAQTCVVRPLSFGYTWQGQTKSVDKFDFNNAMCVYFSQTTTSRTYRISLPTQLTSGTNSIPISFSSTDAAFTYITTSTIGPTTINPNNPFVTPNGTRQVYLFLGGTIQVPQNTPSGNYQATVAITVSFF